MSDSSKFWNRLAKRYSRQKIGNPEAYAEKLRRTRLLMTPQTQVLEFGCGTGGTARTHAPHVAHIRAVDYSEQMIAIAKERQSDEGVENVTFEVASINQVATDERYDIVMGMSVLHLLPNWQAVVAKAYDLTKPGGHFVTSTVVMDKSPWILRAMLGVLGKTNLLPTIQFIGAEAIKAEMEKAGFQVVDEWRPSPKASVFLVGQRAG